MGPAGSVGPAGPAGPQGTPGFSGYRILQGTFPVAPGAAQGGQHNCGNGPNDRVLGGGFSVMGLNASYSILDNRPNRTNNWLVAVQNDVGGPTITVLYYAICGRVG